VDADLRRLAQTREALERQEDDRTSLTNTCDGHQESGINGGLQLSALERWWAEAYDRENGWALSGGGFRGRIDPRFCAGRMLSEYLAGPYLNSSSEGRFKA
jgi:hypothetical protein